MKMASQFLVAGLLALLTACAATQPHSHDHIDCRSCEDWNQPYEPFRIYGNTYYVGVAGLSSILVDTGDGLVVIDGGLPQSAPIILENIQTLGFDPANVQAILVSHVHFDHVGGVAALQAATGAPVYAHSLAVPALRSARMSEDDPQFGYQADVIAYPPVTGDIVSDDLQHFRIGGEWFKGIFTPGHTPGGMSWTWQSCVAARCLDVVYADSIGPISAEGYRFTEGLGDAVRESAETIAALPCDIFITNHPFRFELQAKREAGWHAFIDGNECIDYSLTNLEALEKRLAEEQAESTEYVD